MPTEEQKITMESKGIIQRELSVRDAPKSSSSLVVSSSGIEWRCLSNYNRNHEQKRNFRHIVKPTKFIHWPYDNREAVTLTVLHMYIVKGMYL